VESELKRHLFLTGYRGSGKTSVGRILTETLRLPLVDLDAEIEATAQMTIREIFAEGGEQRFRNLEADELTRCVARPQAIISLGGGAILRQSNFDLIRETGWCVWLDADAETLSNRINGDVTTADRRPSLTSQSGIDEIRTLLDKRRPLYESISSLRVDTTYQSMQQTASIIADWFSQLAKH
jgi:shikimate kinase